MHFRRGTIHRPLEYTRRFVCDRKRFPSRVVKYLSCLLCPVIVIAQAFVIIEMQSNYEGLYLLVNSSSPDTFWHVYYEAPRVSVRRAFNFSVTNDSIIVMACGRDVAEALPIFRKNLYSIITLFKDYHILLGESDSSDETLSRFLQWQLEDDRVHVDTYGSLSATYSKNRAHRIAFCRNDQLQTIRRHNWTNTARFLLVMDIDINANPILTQENFLTNFGYDIRDWAVMTASQTRLYYDIWAVRTQILNYDCWAVVDPSKYQEIARKMYIDVHTKPIPTEFGLIPVLSAFGGFAIYQTAYVNNCYYEAFDKNAKQKCEHVSFHDCVVRNGGKIFINPKFQNADGLTH